jgi:hypothetical protein
MKISKKRESALLEKMLNFFFFSICPKVIPSKVSTVKKAKMSSIYFLIRSKNVFSKLLRFITPSLPKKVDKNSRFFFFTVYRVHVAVVGGNFLPMGEYSNTVKNRRK